jgi:hypothetical protein
MSWAKKGHTFFSSGLSNLLTIHPFSCTIFWTNSCRIIFIRDAGARQPCPRPNDIIAGIVCNSSGHMIWSLRQLGGSFPSTDQISWAMIDGVETRAIRFVHPPIRPVYFSRREWVNKVFGGWPAGQGTRTNWSSDRSGRPGTEIGVYAVQCGWHVTVCTNERRVPRNSPAARAVSLSVGWPIRRGPPRAPAFVHPFPFPPRDIRAPFALIAAICMHTWENGDRTGSLLDKLGTAYVAVRTLLVCVFFICISHRTGFTSKLTTYN